MYLAFEPYKKDLGFAARFYYATMGKLFVLKADRILTCSRHSKQDIIKKYKAAENKIKIIRDRSRRHEKQYLYDSASDDNK